MKRIINTKDECETIQMHDAMNHKDGIIAYHTNGNTGWAILLPMKNRHGCCSDKYGFLYLRDLMLGHFHGDGKYEDNCIKNCIAQVMYAGKKVFYFESYNDFIKTQQEYK